MDRSLNCVLMEHLWPMRNLARLLATDSRRAAAEGDGATALANIQTMLGISRQNEETPFLISGLVAISLSNMALETIEHVLSSQQALWSDSQLQELAHTLAVRDFDVRFWMRGEEACFQDIVQRIYTDNGHGDGHITVEGLRSLNSLVEGSYWFHESYSPSPHLALPAVYCVFASRSEMLSKYRQVWSQVLADLDQPMWEISAEQSGEQMVQQMSESTDHYRYPLITLLLPAFDALRATVERGRGNVDGALIGIALELYHRKHDAWPESLDELSPRWLPSVPVDRITGKPVRYVLRYGRPIVYSVGADRDDDGGRPPEEDKRRTSSYSAAARWIAEDPHPSVNVPDGDWLLWPQRDLAADFALSDANASQTESP